MASSVTVKSYRKEREKEIIDGLEKAMVNVKGLIQRQAIENLRHGRPYPKWDKGRLGANVAEHSHIEKEGNTITAVIGTNVDYGLFLELGILRKDNSIVHYPWLFPAVELKRKEIIETIKAAGGKNIDIEVVGGIWEK
jgi:phage gpG-like protein